MKSPVLDLAKVLKALPLEKLSSKQTLLLAFAAVALLVPVASLFFKIDWQHITLAGLYYLFVLIMQSRLR